MAPLSEAQALAKAKDLLQNAKSGRTVNYEGVSGRTIGVMIPWTDNEGFQALYLGIATSIIKAGDSMLTASAQNNVETGSSIIRVFINQNVDAIVMDPFDAAAFVPVILSANEAGIPVISYDQVPVGGAVAGAFVSDNKQLGAATADLALQAGRALGQAPAEIKVLELMGSQSAPAGVDRHVGFSRRAKDLGITVVAQLPTDWDTTRSNAAVLDGFQAHPDINTISIASDCAMYQGVKSALKSIGKFKNWDDPGAVRVVSIDGCPVALDAIRAGHMYGAAVQPLFEIGLKNGALGVAAASGDGRQHSVRSLPPKLVTSANVDDPGNWANIVQSDSAPE